VKLKPLKHIGVSVILSIQLLAVPAPTQAATLGLIDTGGLLGDLLGFAFPFLQGLSTDLLDGLSIGGIDLSSVIMDVVFSSDGLLNGGGLNVGGLLGTAGEALDPVLDQIPGGQQIYSILSGVLDGSISLQSLLKGGLLESILATILDGSSDGLSNPSTGEIGGNSPGGGGTNNPATATIGGGGILGTGSVTCLYASTCRPNSNPHQTIFSRAIGAQGYPNPNEVRGKIYQAATSGEVLSDVYAPNPSIGAYYAGNQSDRDINRATTEAYLSKAGQEQQQKISQTAMDTVKSVTELVKNCASRARSSQELIRCNLLVDSVSPSFDAAQLSVMMKMQQDDQFQKLQLGNISASMDAQRRQRDVENAGLSISSMKAIWTTPSKW
jgi:hypothetical protein